MMFDGVFFDCKRVVEAKGLGQLLQKTNLLIRLKPDAAENGGKQSFQPWFCVWRCAWPEANHNGNSFEFMAQSN